MNIYFYYRSTSGASVPSVKSFPGSWEDGVAKLKKETQHSATPIVLILEEMVTTKEIINLIGVLTAQRTAIPATEIALQDALAYVIKKLRADMIEKTRKRSRGL
jgi:hypothetical protein